MISPRLALALFVIPGTVIAQHIPVTNWTVPPYRAGTSASGGLAPMVDISPSMAFTAMDPCRVVDTREPTSQYFGPMAAFSIRTFDLNDGFLCGLPGIPADVQAYSLNIGAIVPPADGFLKAWRAGTHEPGNISQLNFLAGEVIANAAIVPAGTGGAINVLVNVGPTHLYIDVNGYFTANQNPDQYFEASGSRDGPLILVQNSSAAIDAEAIRGVISSTSPGYGSAGVRGVNNGTGSEGIGVWGSHAGNGTGVYGSSLSGTGVWGDSHNPFPGSPSFGVVGRSNSSETGSSGVFGSTSAFFGTIFGVTGFSASESDNSAGVLGVAKFTPHTVSLDFAKSGLRGESANGGIGTMGISDFTGAAGYLMELSTDTIVAEGLLGTNFGTDPGSGAPPWGVFALGDIGASGTKHFVDPHPSDPSKAISYVSLEGPEAGTYFRGRARFQSGIARITVPEHFRLVTDPEGLSVQVTPIGAMATVAVLRVDRNEIVVQSSRDVEFFYIVQGVREAFRNIDPVISAAPFSPRTPDARIPAYLSEEQKRRLIANGTYNADGTVNVETARRLGWDRMWQARSGPPEAAPIP